VPATAISAHYAQAAPSEISRRELYFFNLFRVFQATLLVSLVFSPLALSWWRTCRSARVPWSTCA
jgi:hypothetical protein